MSYQALSQSDSLLTPTVNEGSPLLKSKAASFQENSPISGALKRPVSLPEPLSPRNSLNIPSQSDATPPPKRSPASPKSENNPVILIVQKNEKSTIDFLANTALNETNIFLLKNILGILSYLSSTPIDSNNTLHANNLSLFLLHISYTKTPRKNMHLKKALEDEFFLEASQVIFKEDEGPQSYIYQKRILLAFLSNQIKSFEHHTDSEKIFERFGQALHNVLQKNKDAEWAAEELKNVSAIITVLLSAVAPHTTHSDPEKQTRKLKDYKNTMPKALYTHLENIRAIKFKSPDAIDTINNMLGATESCECFPPLAKMAVTFFGTAAVGTVGLLHYLAAP